LRALLTDLNKVLGQNQLLVDGEQITLVLDDKLAFDVARFQSCLEQMQSHDHPPDQVCPACLPLLQEAAELYQADFLEGYTLRDTPEFDDWQFFQSESLRQDLALVLERLVQGYTAQEDYDTALPHVRRWLSLDPLHEPAQRAVIQLYAWAGQEAAALRQYEEYVKLLDEELGLPPEEETITLYEAIKAQRIIKPLLKAAQSEPNGGGVREQTNDAPTRPFPENETPAAKSERYDLLSQIGQGGFATVYRTRDRELDRLVALKELKSSLLADTNWIRRFRREAKLIARLDHPHVVPIYDVGQRQGRPFIVMRLIEGQSLAEYLTERGRLTWTEALEIVKTVSAGLAYAHRRGILHRDLKPANILIDPDRGPFLSDFGLAKLVDDNSLSQSQEIVGTTHYIAPEIWDGEAATPQTDIYALGCILYEMLTGQRLFIGETPPSVMRAHFQPLSLPTSWPQDIPAGLTEVLHKALAKQPNERYATVPEFVAALTGLSGEQTGQSDRPDSQIVLKLAARERDAGNYQAALDLLTELLPHTPAAEPLHRELMRLYALAGQRHTALRQYQDCVEALATTNTKPDPETEALYQQIINDELAPPASTPKPTIPPLPTTIAGHLAPLVGREQELETFRAKIEAAWHNQGGTLLLAQWR
jgi:serine/threonine protein kinase